MVNVSASNSGVNSGIKKLDAYDCSGPPFFFPFVL